MPEYAPPYIYTGLYDDESQVYGLCSKYQNQAERLKVHFNASVTEQNALYSRLRALREKKLSIFSQFFKNG